MNNPSAEYFVAVLFSIFQFCSGAPSRGSTGILVHGCHLQATGWESIVWGDESKQLLGRVPQAVLVAHHEDADLVVFGTGGSKSPDGILEGKFTVEYLWKNFDKLSRFHAFKSLDLSALKTKMERCVKTEVTSLNTQQELLACGNMFQQAGISRVILVSSPTHLPRCLRDASWIYAENNFGFRHRLLACPSATSYAGCCPQDVAVVEPPHRGDRDTAFDNQPDLLLHNLISRFYSLPRVQQKEVQLAWRRELDVLSTVSTVSTVSSVSILPVSL